MTSDAHDLDGVVHKKPIGKVRLLTLDDLDGRTRAATRARELRDRLVGDLGGEDEISTGQDQLAQRGAILGAIAEDAEARWVSGGDVAIGDYLATVNAQRRVLTTIGLERRAKDITLTLRERLTRDATK